MAKKMEIEILPIDVLDDTFDNTLPEVVPLKRKVAKELLDNHKHCLRLLEAWARIHLRALAAHPLSPNKFADNLIDNLGGKAMDKTMNKLYEKFSRVHVLIKEKPIGFDMEDEDLASLCGDLYLDDVNLLEPERKKKKGSCFTRFLKWASKKSTKEEQEEEQEKKKIEKMREMSYDEVKVNFEKFLEEEVRNYRDARNLRLGDLLTNPENLSNVHGHWIADMTHRLQICHMAFKILGIVREKCIEAYSIASFSTPTDDQCFQGDYAKLVQSRLAYLMTMKTVALIMVSDIEKMQMESVTYQECVDSFRRSLPRHRLLSRMDSVESKVIKCMKEKDSFGDQTSPSHEKAAENLLKSESKRNLLLATDDQDILGDSKMFGNTSGSSADIEPPGALGRVPVTVPNGGRGCSLQIKVIPNGAATDTDQSLVAEHKPLEDSTSDYSSASTVSQMSASKNTTHEGRPSLFELPDPVTDGSRQELTSKESTSPMQTSPPAEMPSDRDSTDDSKEDKKVKADEGSTSTKKLPSDEDSTDKLKEDIEKK